MTEAAWVAVGASGGLAPGAVMRAVVRGTDLAVWRDPEGVVHAWRNQCPHRGMRLSFGYVDNDGRLACRYHGWRLAPDGKCGAIPAHPDQTPPDDISVTAFASSEQDGLIWVALADAPLPGEIASTGEALVFCRSLVAHASAELVADTVSGHETAPGIIRTECAGAAVVLVLQPIEPRRTSIHLLAQANDANQAARRLEVAAWGRALRHRIETQVTADD